MNPLTSFSNTLSSLFQKDPPTRSGEASTENRDDEAAIQSLEIRAERLDFSMSDGDSNLSGFSDVLSLDATIRQGDTITRLEIDIEHTVLAFGGALAPDEFRESLLESMPDDVREQIEQYIGQDPETLSDLLSPEAVSQRITDFAFGGYVGFLGEQVDSNETRGSFLELIRPAIEKGFDEALDLLKPFLDEPTEDLVGETRGLVHEKLDNFLGVDLTA